jgi:opacity protein-like surface antigen
MRKVLLTVVGAAALTAATAANAAVTFSGTTSGCFETPGGSGCVLAPAATDNGTLNFSAGTFSQTTNAANFAGIGGTTNNFGSITLFPSLYDYSNDTFDLLITFTSPPGTGAGSFTANLLGSLTSDGTGGVNFNFLNPTQYVTDGAGGTYEIHVNDLAFSGSDLGTNLSLTQDINGYIIAAVPEPATWGLMLLGFAGIGFAMRRQRGKAVLAQVA